MTLGFTILFIAGITNILFLLLVFFSCRCMGGSKITQRLFSKEWYTRFYAKHCYFWYGFFISVLTHTILAFYLFGWPF
ncbi:hypothetical protein HOL21_00715 [Candidatus Woesearchaeota archaeon]|nr:hypothetical protein [Candidatus Woesearchaeota archaeon]MBT5396718.1 hypothetical protein [Candidatus Woesearchaeota archaeon]MBT5924516.1 hypothetical protein [Candidatus Woesearchaeota archaeon]MBT6367495.1 hypothetical protein [Candidatus Woesearchaeota archaeon]MBT7762994.1 hypothetical protein [Candidatus Woesearchaeota archaeon]